MAPEARRSMLVQATLPLLLENGEMVTTRQIAEAAGIAEGTIFRAFADKDELIAAVVDAAFDPEPLETALSAIDPSLPFEAKLEAATTILQERVVHLWRLLSSIGPRFHDGKRRPQVESAALIRILEAHRDRLAIEPSRAAWLLRAFTLSATHPVIVDAPLPAAEIVELFLHGAAGKVAPC